MKASLSGAPQCNIHIFNAIFVFVIVFVYLYVYLYSKVIPWWKRACMLHLLPWHSMQKDRFPAEIALLHQFSPLMEHLRIWILLSDLYTNILKLEWENKHFYQDEPFWCSSPFVCRIYYWLPRLLQCLEQQQQQQQLTILNMWFIPC